MLIVVFTDEGKSCDPTQKAYPDIKLSADERTPGGLGIFLTKKLMDSFEYGYRNGRNILTKLSKQLRTQSITCNAFRD